MKIQPPLVQRISPPFIHCMIATAMFGAAGICQAAFIIEPNGKASANYVAGTATTNSTLAGVGTLLAPGLTLNAASVYGGEPYTYTYTPGVDGNNTAFSSATVLNSPAGIFASGLAAGGAGIYKVYHVFPQTTNASGQPTLYQILLNGGTTGVTMIKASQDQNVSDGTTGVGTGLWELIGQVSIQDANDVLTLQVNTTTTGFVGARTAGVLIDYVSPIPEPHAASLLGLSGLVLLYRRRTRE